MTEHDILTDAERKALNEVMHTPVIARQSVLIVEDDQLQRELLAASVGIARVRRLGRADTDRLAHGAP